MRETGLQQAPRDAHVSRDEVHPNAIDVEVAVDEFGRHLLERLVMLPVLAALKMVN
jgi:hypothetical protein